MPPRAGGGQLLGRNAEAAPDRVPDPMSVVDSLAASHDARVGFWPKHVDEEHVEAEFSRAKGLIEGVIQKLGVDPESASVASEADQASWTLQRGSAAIVITLLKRSDWRGPGKGVFVRVISPVMKPAAGSREALYRRLLELNAGGLANAAFGVLNEQIVAVSERPSDGLDAGELDQMVRHLAAVADTYDDRLVKDFGGKRFSDKS